MPQTQPLPALLTSTTYTVNSGAYHHHYQRPLFTNRGGGVSGGAGARSTGYVNEASAVLEAFEAERLECIGHADLPF
jgi:hypothetical protein